MLALSSWLTVPTENPALASEVCKACRLTPPDARPCQLTRLRAALPLAHTGEHSIWPITLFSSVERFVSMLATPEPSEKLARPRWLATALALTPLGPVTKGNAVLNGDAALTCTASPDGFGVNVPPDMVPMTTSEQASPE